MVWRKYSHMGAMEIRNTDLCGLQEAVKRRQVSLLLDKVEQATLVEELRLALAEFITLQTGIK